MSGNDHNGGDTPADFGQLLQQSLLPYPKWLEEAQRGVMMKALEYVAAEGLPGEHHFFISYRTDFPGVELPDSLRARYPETITIVLQRQFGELKVSRIPGQEEFSVLLSFSGQPALLTIPFKAVTTFADPAVPLELHFSVPIPLKEEDWQEEEDEDGEMPASEDGSAEVVQLDRFRKKTPPPPPPPPSGGESA